MNIDKLNDEAREFIETVHELKTNFRPGYFSLVACVFASSENGVNGFPETEAMINSATEEELNEAIQILCEYRHKTEYQKWVDNAINYIRREWLRKEGEA